MTYSQDEFIDLLVSMDQRDVMRRMVFVIHAIIDQIIEHGIELPDGFDLWSGWADNFLADIQDDGIYHPISNHFQSSLRKSTQHDAINGLYDAMAHIDLYYRNPTWWTRDSIWFVVSELSRSANKLVGCNDGFAIVRNMMMGAP